jgi:hypothetical protein
MRGFGSTQTANGRWTSAPRRAASFTVPPGGFPRDVRQEACGDWMGRAWQFRADLAAAA